MGAVDVDIRIWSHLKVELAWVVYKRLWIISTLKNSKSTKELKRTKEQSHFKFKTIVYVAMWPLITYSNYFKIFSTMTFLVSRTRLS